jgi:sirohydrochlorin ferrochelatase
MNASIAILPFLFMAQKARYRAAGGMSRASRQLDSLAEHVESSLSTSGFGIVGSASVEGDHDLEHAVASAARRGYRQIVVAAAMVGGSLELDRGKRKVDALRLAEKGVRVAYTDVLADSERVASLVASRIMAVAGDATGTGVVLVGAAQPDARAKDRRDFDEQESSFLNRVRMYVLDRGLAESHVRIAWAEWRTPDVTSAVRHLAAMGCLRIIVAPACFPLDTIQSTLDIQIAVRQARLDPSVAAITLTGYASDPGFAEELRGRALRALATVES